jgi:uncharacterized protein YerC
MGTSDRRRVTPSRDPDYLLDDLCDALLTPSGRVEMRSLLRDLCTPAELRRLLDETDMPYRDIHLATGVSTTTIVRVGRFLRLEPHQGYRRAIDALGAADAR